MTDRSQFETVQFLEPAFGPGEVFPGTVETQLGVFAAEHEAIDMDRAAWRNHRESGSRDVAWWLVRVSGEALARWIADGGSPVERVLDIRTNQLVEVDGG